MDSGTATGINWGALAKDFLLVLFGAVAAETARAISERTREKRQRGQSFDQETYKLCTETLEKLRERSQALSRLPDVICGDGPAGSAEAAEGLLAAIAPEADLSIRLGRSAGDALKLTNRRMEDVLAGIAEAHRAADALLGKGSDEPALEAIVKAFLEDRLGEEPNVADRSDKGALLVAHTLATAVQTGRPATEQRDSLLDLLPESQRTASVVGLVSLFLDRVERLRTSTKALADGLAITQFKVEARMTAITRSVFGRQEPK